MPPRVLILTASVGEGHDHPARTLAEQLRAEREDVEITVVDALQAMGRVVRAISADAATVVFFHWQWLWDLGFWIFTGPRVTRAGTQALLARVGAPGVLRVVAERRPDVIVSTYPNVTEVLGRLRRQGRIGVPVCAAITDLAALHYWASPGIDLHLVTHRESIAEVHAVAGADVEVVCVHGLTSAEFLVPLAEADARAALALPRDGRIVLVSGGGWGVGDVEGAALEALRFDEVAQVVCLCGRNGALRARLATLPAVDARVRVEGFTDAMPAWLAAADVLVHSTGGSTVLEARMRGCVPISYGWGRGHVARNDEAYRRHGLAEVAERRGDLHDAIARALRRGRQPLNGFGSLPSAASAVLSLAEGVVAPKAPDERPSPSGVHSVPP